MNIAESIFDKLFIVNASDAFLKGDNHKVSF